jgi:hypothetical protein
MGYLRAIWYRRLRPRGTRPTGSNTTQTASASMTRLLRTGRGLQGDGKPLCPLRERLNRAENNLEGR